MTGQGVINFLLVDDLEENLLALEALLQREGLNCLKARSGEEALELLLVHEFALALLDVQMPEMDGFQLAEFMRGSERTRHVPIIFLTAGSADTQRRFRGYEAGAVDFIQKPIEADILRGKANVFFDLYQQRQLIVTQRDELEAYANVLQSIDRRKNEFLAVLGHELRNPVMALSAVPHLLKKHGIESERGATILEQMQRQVHHLGRLVDDLLDISRIDQGKIALRKERAALQNILGLAVEASQPQIDARHHTLHLDIEEQTVWLDVDVTRVVQIVSNLLNNAAKYTPVSGKIELASWTVGDYIVIEVRDNGVGIPAEMQSKIFDLFTQVGREDPSAPAGLGIGLALVKQLVELHGGDISLASAGSGQGSTFKVRLPFAEASSAPQPHGTSQ